MSKVRRQIRKINRDSERSKKRTQISRRRYAIVFFVVALVFCIAEVFAVFTAKSQHDYRLAKTNADELAVELGLISSALYSGDKTLYENSVERYKDTLAVFTGNDYVQSNQANLLGRLREYNATLASNKNEISELLELDAAMSGIQSELQSVDIEKLDAVNFYQIQQSFQTLRDALSKLETSDLGDLRDRLDSFATKVSELAKNSAVCVSVCPKESFVEKQKTLESYRNEFESDFDKLGREISEKYDPSSLVISLGEL